MNIMVIGELCEDIFVYGKVKRLCPEAPVPVFNPSYEIRNNGMSGNVVENIKAIKSDANIIFWHQKEKIIKQRLIDEKSNQMIVRVDTGDEASPMGDLSPGQEKIISNVDLVIVSDYDKGFLNERNLISIAKLSPVSILDTKKKISLEIVEAFTFIKLNESEGQLNNDISHNKNVIITLGSKGAKMGINLFPQYNPKETIDVSGAGDTFVAAMGVKYIETKDIKTAITFANQMAGIVVGKRGVAIP